MAFGGFGNSGNTMSALGSGGGAGGVVEGPELELIQTELLGFKSIAGEAKVRLTTPWSQLPSDNSSLLSIAARRGLVAAAGPDRIVLSSTDSVRKAFEGTKEGDSDILGFEPQLKLPLPMRVSQIAFTADEAYLVLSAESGGGLAVYQTADLLQGNQQAAFELGTNGESLRALVPNPTTEKAELCAIVTNNGNLHMANFKERQLSNVLKTGVSCVSWSTKGKQLVAGLADGTVSQMTPEGEGKGEIPSPPNVSNAHVSALSWLENHIMLVVHTTTNETSPSSVYHLISRQPPSSFTFQRMTDPVDPFGAEKAPHYSIQRLKDFPPSLQDLLIVCSTASPDVGLISRSKTPLTSDKSADAISNVFTTTELLDDSKRAQLPMSESFENTIPVGVALDLSSKEKVYKPLPADEEIEDSPGPVPGYWVLNNEGLLCSWWVIYEESIRKGTTYPGIATADDSASTAAASTERASAPAPAFSNTTGNSAFGSSPAFGGASALGSKPSPWGMSQTSSPTAFGQSSGAFGSGSFGNTPASSPPAFGKPSALGFGQSTQLGARSSPWSTGGASGDASSTAGGPTFGQSGFAGMAGNKTAFGGGSSSNVSSLAPASGGFANFAGSSGFATAGSNSNGSGSIFASKPSGEGSFGSASKESSNTAFPPPKDGNAGGGLFGGQSFKLESSFKPDPASQHDNEKPATSGGGSSLFGSNFGSALRDTTQQKPSKDEAMDAAEEKQQQPPSKSPFSLAGTQAASQAPASQSQLGLGDKPSPFAPGSSPFSTAGQASQTQSTKSLFSLGGQTSSTAPSASPFSSAGQTSQTQFGKSPFSLGGQSLSPATSTSPFGKPSVDASQTQAAKSPFSVGTKQPSPFSQGDTLQASQPKSPSSASAAQSTTPTTTPAPNRFAFAATADATTPKGGLFGQSSGGSGSGLFETAKPSQATSEDEAPEIKVEDEEAPLPPESTSKNTYPLGESSSSSAATDGSSKNTSKVDAAPLPPDFLAKPQTSQTTAAETAPLPPDPSSTPKAARSAETKEETTSPTETPAVSKPSITFTYSAEATFTSDESNDESDESEAGEAPLPANFVDKATPKGAPSVPALPDTGKDSELEDDEADDAESEGSGVIVGKDTSPSTTGFTQTPGFTPQSSFGKRDVSQAQGEKSRSLFGEMSRNAPMFPRPNATSPRSPSPVRSAVPNRMSQHAASRSVSAPGMASQILGASKRGSQTSLTAVASRAEEDPQLKQQRLARSRREAQETKVLEDEEDDEIQKILASEIEPSLKMDDFIAHSNAAPSSQETIPSQVEAVYRDINSMIDTLGLNARSLASFITGHKENYKEEGRSKDDLESPNDWVLCEVNDLGDVVERELARDLADGRVQDVEDKMEACQDLSREMSRLRSKQEDLKKLITVRLDPNQTEISRSLPLSTEQATQQNELRREYAKFSKHLVEAEEALTLLKTKLASLSSASGKGNANVPTVEAVMRTIAKMTSMVEKRSGDVDVLENQMRRLRFSSVGGNSREGSPMVTPQKSGGGRSSVLFSPDTTVTGSPRNPRNSLMSSVTSAGGGVRNTTPRKKVSGFSTDEKTELMAKRAKRRAVLEKLRANVQKNGVQAWPMPDDME